jgi:peptide/nickel transport system substrate-binding protein
MRHPVQLVKKSIFLLPIVLVLVGILFACTATQPNSNISRNGRITIGTTSTIKTLDPADAYDQLTGNIHYNTLERLYAYKPGTTELVPQLAAAMPKVSPDGLIYTIPVRSGVRFHDRTDFTSEAMAFSLRRFIKLKGAPSFLMSDLIRSAQSNGLSELIVTLKRPFPLFPQLLAFPGAGAVSPLAYGGSSNKDFFPKQIVGTGPYQLAQYVEGSLLRLDVFPDYWGKTPENKGIDIQFLSSNANLLNAFKTGAVDVAFQTLSPTQIRNLETNASQQGWTVASNQGSTMLFMVLNVAQPPLDNIKVRQALAAAIDRPLLQERVFQGQRIPVYSLIPSTLRAYQPVFQKLYGDGNAKLARKLLTEAGYSDDNPAKISIWYTPKYAGNGDLVASTLKAAIAKSVGKILQIKLEKVDQTVAYSFIDKGVYPAFLLDWVPDFFDPDNFSYPFLLCEEVGKNGCTKGGSQYWGSFYNNPEMNQLLTQQRVETDSVKRDRIFAKIQDILGRDVPFIPLWQNREYAFARPGVKRVGIEPTQQLPYSSIRKT